MGEQLQMLAQQGHVGDRARGTITALLVGVIAALALALAAPAPASALLSPPADDYLTHIVSVDGVAYVTRDDDAPRQWHRLTPAPALVPVRPDTQLSSELDLEAIRPSEECRAHARQPCFRPHPSRWGVEISNDGGSTWQADLGATDLQLERMTNTLWGPGNPEDAPHVIGVVPVRWHGEDTVIAASGFSALAIRTPDGTWDLWRATDYEEPFERWDLPPPVVASASSALLHVVFIGPAAIAIAAMVLGFARRWESTWRTDWWRLVLVIVLSLGASLIAIIMAMLSHIAPERGFAVDELQGTAPWALGLLAMVAAMLWLLRFNAREPVWRVLLMPLAVGLPAAALPVALVLWWDQAGWVGAAANVYDLRVLLTWFIAGAVASVITWRRWLPAFERPHSVAPQPGRTTPVPG